MVLVDNAAYSYGHQIHNGIPIIPFFDNPNDTVFYIIVINKKELLELLDFLKILIQFEDMRELNKGFFKMHKYQNS